MFAVAQDTRANPSRPGNYSTSPEYPRGHPKDHLSRLCSLVHPHKIPLLSPQLPLVPVMAPVDGFRSRAAPEQEELPL